MTRARSYQSSNVVHRTDRPIMVSRDLLSVETSITYSSGPIKGSNQNSGYPRMSPLPFLAIFIVLAFSVVFGTFSTVSADIVTAPPPAEYSQEQLDRMANDPWTARSVFIVTGIVIIALEAVFIFGLVLTKNRKWKTKPEPPSRKITPDEATRSLEKSKYPGV